MWFKYSFNVCRIDDAPENLVWFCVPFIGLVCRMYMVCKWNVTQYLVFTIDDEHGMAFVVDYTFIHIFVHETYHFIPFHLYGPHIYLNVLPTLLKWSSQDKRFRMTMIINIRVNFQKQSLDKVDQLSYILCVTQNIQ